MSKLNKMYYHTSKGEKKLNCYYITIPKEIVEQAGLNEQVKMSVKGNKIIIENQNVDKRTKV